MQKAVVQKRLGGGDRSTLKARRKRTFFCSKKSLYRPIEEAQNIL